MVLLAIDRMRIIGWILVLSGFSAALFLAYEAVTIPYLRGATLAQADFELFVFSVVLGVPGVTACVIGMLLLRRYAAKQTTGGYRFPLASAAITGLTVLTVISAFIFSLMIRSYGFFWR